MCLSVTNKCRTTGAHRYTHTHTEQEDIDLICSNDFPRHTNQSTDSELILLKSNTNENLFYFHFLCGSFAARHNETTNNFSLMKCMCVKNDSLLFENDDTPTIFVNFISVIITLTFSSSYITCT